MQPRAKKYYDLKPPSLLRRVWKIWAYNIFWSALFGWVFLGYYSLERVAYELDYLMFYGVSVQYFRIESVTVILSFWFFFRQIMKDINLIKYTVATAKHDKEIIEKGGYKRSFEAVEGTGKTLNTANETLFLAAKKDHEMKLDYFLKCPFSDELKDDVKFNVLKHSYEFYNEHPDRIPHFMANFETEYKNRKQYDFDMDYIDQNKRPPDGLAIGLTEVGNILPNAWSKMPADESKDKHNRKVKNETLSLTRQYLDAHIIVDEQRTGEIYLGLRSVIGQNKDIIRRRKVLEPHLLIKVLKGVDGAVFKLRENNKKWLSKLRFKLYYLIEDIGFYVFEYHRTDAEKGKEDKEIEEFVISCDIPFTFDTRGERRKYKLLNDKPQ